MADPIVTLAQDWLRRLPQMDRWIRNFSVRGAKLYKNSPEGATIVLNDSPPPATTRVTQFDILVKVTGDGGYQGGWYAGTVWSGPTQNVDPTADLAINSGMSAALPDGLDPDQNVIVANDEETGLPTHWIADDTFVECVWDGGYYTDQDDNQFPLVRVSGVPVYKTDSPQIVGDDLSTGASTSPPADTWTRGVITDGTDYGNTPTRHYRQLVWRDDTNKKLVQRTWYEDYDAAGRLFYRSAASDATLLESCT